MEHLLTVTGNWAHYKDSEVEKSATEVLKDPKLVQKFMEYLENHRSGDKVLPHQFLDVYEQCEEYMKTDLLLTEDDRRIEELSDLGLLPDQKNSLKKSVKTGDRTNINNCLMRIQGECANKIEAADEFRVFKELKYQ